MSQAAERARLVDQEVSLRQVLDQQLLALGTAWRAIPAGSRQQARDVVAGEGVIERMDAEFGLLTSTEAAVRAGLRRPHREWASSLRTTGRLLGFRRGSREYRYPGFQFDRGGQLLPVMGDVLAVAQRSGVSPIDVAIWCVSPSRWFEDDGRPVDFLERDPQLVLRAAESAFETEW